jgi:hypothetical protein
MTMLVGKLINNNMDKVAVTYYPLLVTEQCDDWPEGIIAATALVVARRCFSRNRS